MAGVRVVPVFRPRGAGALAIFVGASAGVAEAWLDENLGHPANAHWGLALAVHLLPVTLFGAAVAVNTQRRGTIFRAVWTSGFSYLFFAGLASSLLSPHDRWATLTFPGVCTDALQMAVVAGVAGVFAVVIVWLVRSVIVVVEQTGTLCWRCGYDAGSPAILRCPECGTPIDAGKFKYRWVVSPFGWLCGRSPVLLLALGVSLVIAAVLTARAQGTLAARRFASRFYSAPKYALISPPENMLPGWIPDPVKTDGQTPIACLGASVPVVGDPNLVLLVSYLPVPHGGAPSMRIELSTLNRAGATAWVLPANPAVFCHLGRARAEYVVAQGLPDSLVQAMLTASNDAGSSTSFQSGPWSPLEVNPDGHFPSLE